MPTESKKWKTEIPAIAMALNNKETPLHAKILAAITVGYALSPIDLIPDFIPVLGYLDDLIILPLLAGCTIRCIPKDVMNSCRIRSKDMWQDGKPEKWYYAIPVIVLWILIILWLIRVIL